MAAPPRGVPSVSPGVATPLPQQRTPSTAVANLPEQPSRWRALRNYNYRTYLMGNMVSQPGTWLQRTAQAWLVLQISDSPLALGMVTVFQFLPLMLLSLVAGVVSDRVTRRKLIMVTTTVQLVQAVILAVLVWANVVQLWHVLVLALVLGLATAFETPSRQAILSELVERDELQTAVALNSSVFNAARIVGPGIAGVLIAVWGTAICFALNGVSFVGVLITLAMLHVDEMHAPRRPARAAVLKQLGDGLRYALNKPELVFPIALLACIGTFGVNFGVFTPLIAKDVLGLGAEGFGSLNSAMGIGSLIGAVGIATRLQPRARLVLLMATFFSVLLIVLAVVPWYLASLLVFALFGGANVLYTSLTNTTLQLNSGEEYRGRVLSLYSFLIQGTTPIGGALTGWLAEVWGVQWTIGLEGGICLLSCVGGYLYLRRRQDRTNT